MTCMRHSASGRRREAAGDWHRHQRTGALHRPGSCGAIGTRMRGALIGGSSHKSGFLEVAVEISVRTNGFKIDQPNGFLNGVAKQVELPLTAELVDKQCCKVGFLAFPNQRVYRDFFDGGINVDYNVVVKFLVLPGKTPRLQNFVVHTLRLRGTNGVAYSRGSAMEISDSATKVTGKSGLSSAALPTMAQNSIWPAMVRRSAFASARACS